MITIKALHLIAFALLVIGGLNVGLSALGFNALNMFLGGMPMLETLLYLLVGLSAAYLAINHTTDCKACR